MRLSSLALLSTLVAARSLALADRPAARPPSPAEDAEAVAALAKSSITAGEPGALDALMGPSVRYDLRGLSPCTGVGSKGTARGAKRTKLAHCVVQRVRGLDDALRHRVVRQGRSKDRFWIELEVERHQLELELRPSSGDLVVVAVRFRENHQPISDLRTWSDEGGVEGGEIGGVVGGVVSGVPGGVVGGVVGSPPPPPPPPPPSQIISPSAIEHQRISGERNLMPDAATRDAIVASGKTQVIIPVKLCVDTVGAVDSVKVIKSSGFPVYDAAIKAGVATWRYRPFTVNGVAAPVCSVVTFLYRVPPTP